MAWKHSVLKVCGRFAPRPYQPPSGVLFPYAHIVSDVIPIHVRHLHAVPSIAKFESDLDFLCRHYQPLPLSELDQIQGLRSSRRPARHFLLSFDDGLREAYDVIAPILRQKGVPAIFFVNTATIDNRQLMWRHEVSLLIERSRQDSGRFPPQLPARSTEDLAARLKALRFADQSMLDEIARFFELDVAEYLQRAKPYLTAAQILELARAGFEIGAHSESHPHFNEMAVDDQKRQVSDCVQSIRALGIPCRYFAFPFHDNGVPTSVFEHMAGLGLRLSFGTSEGRFDSIPFSVQRFSLEAGNGDSSVASLLDQLSIKSAVRHLCRTVVIHRN